MAKNDKKKDGLGKAKDKKLSTGNLFEGGYSPAMEGYYGSGQGWQALLEAAGDGEELAQTLARTTAANQQQQGFNSQIARSKRSV